MAAPRPVVRLPRTALKLFYRSVRLSEYDDDGFLGIQVDSDGGPPGDPNEPRVPPYEALHPYGHAGRPLDPEVDPSGEVVTAPGVLELEEGAESFVIALGDARVVPILAGLQKGESIQYGAVGNFVRCHIDGRVSRMTTHDATPNGQTVFDEIGPGGYLCKTPWSVLRNNDTGYHYEHISGARIDMGSISGLPPPFDGLSSYFDVTAHSVRFKCSAAQFGIGAGAMPLAKAPIVLANDSSIASALTAAGAALSALGAITANSAAGPAIAAAVAAIAAAVSTISASATTLPSLSTSAT